MQEIAEAIKTLSPILNQQFENLRRKSVPLKPLPYRQVRGKAKLQTQQNISIHAHFNNRTK